MLDDLLAALAGAEVIAGAPRASARARPRAARALVAAVRVLRRRARLPARQHPDRAPDRGPGAAGRCRRPPTRCAGGVPRSRRSPCTAARRRPGRDVPDGRPGRGPAGRRGHVHQRPAGHPARRRGRLRRREVVEAFRDGVLATCVGPVTAAPFDCTASRCSSPAAPASPRWSAPSRSALPSRRGGTGLDVATGCCSTATASASTGGGRAVAAPLAVLRALAERLGHVVSRRELLGHLPSGHAGSEHAVEVAVGRLRAAVGPRLVQTVVKRGYRLPVT